MVKQTLAELQALYTKAGGITHDVMYEIYEEGENVHTDLNISHVFAIVHVERRKYFAMKLINYQGEYVCYLIPATKGDSTNSDISFNSYAYTNGGRIFREATRLAHEIAQN